MAISESNRVDSRKTNRRPARTWPDWFPKLQEFQKPNSLKASWQLVNTIIPYFGLLCLMILSVQWGYSYLWTLLLAIPAAAFLVRIFILFHDCVHKSLFPGKFANAFFGYFLGMLVFTPFKDWRFSHLRHHGTYANLDTRGFGDIWTLTRTEYESSPKAKQLCYRLYRNPLVFLGLGAYFTFLLRFRLPTSRKTNWKERLDVLYANLAIAAVAFCFIWFLGWKTYLAVQLPVLWMAGVAGIWLFYVQHQFGGVYWARKTEWDPLRAAMEGSSFYKLPTVLRWFSASIGYHHVHHLNSRIPNYRLKHCFDAIPALKARQPLTIRKSISGVVLKLWDEEQNSLVGFAEPTETELR